MSILMDYINKNAEQKKLSSKEWLLAVAKNASKCTLCSHVGRFLHPSADVKILAEKDDGTDDRYVDTAHVSFQPDITVSSAAFMATPKFLLLELEDGRTVWEHFKQNTEKIRQEISELNMDYNNLQKYILQVEENHCPEASDERIRQVYFPVGEEEYHLLSVLPASSLMMETKRRIRFMETNARNVHNKEHESYGKGYKQIFGLSEIGYGGTKPQNISTLNMMNGGRAYLLPSMPPKIRKRNLIPPKRDFFDSLRMRSLSPLFHTLHHFYKLDRNNMDIRHGAREAETAIIERVMEKVFQLRALQSGWSKENGFQLPMEQKIWLDDCYKGEERQEEERWLNEISSAFARWILNSYKNLLKKEAEDLGDGEYKDLRCRIRRILWETKE